MEEHSLVDLNYYELFGVSTILFRELNIEKALDHLKATGFKWIDLTVVPNFCPHYDFKATDQNDDKKLADLIKSYEFKISSLNIFPGYYNLHEPTNVDKILIRAAQLARELNTKILTIPSGARVDPEKWMSSVSKISKNIKRIAKILFDDYGINLSIETPHQKTLTESLDESIRFHEALNSQIIKCTFDSSHIAAQGLSDISKSLKEIGIDRIDHIHLRDARKKDISYTPGKGDIDFISFFRELKSCDYKGKLIFELEYHDYSVKKKLNELQFAFNYSKKIYANGKMPLKFKIKTNPVYLFLEGFLYDPISEIKRHERFFLFIRKFKKIIFGLMPEKVFVGRWVKMYRFNKNKCVVHKPGSVIVTNKPSKILKIGIVGLGYAGAKMHAGGYERLNNCKIVGGFDIDQQKRELFAKRYKCNVFSSLKEMISKEKPDIVSICTREWLHYDAAMYCLKNEVDVFCEKIMATRIVDADTMVKTAKEHNRILAVNYNYRFIPAIQKIKEVIEFQTLGKMAYFVINVHAFSYAHALDLLTYFGGKIKSVSANNQNDQSKRIFAGTDWSNYDEDIQYIPSTSTNVMVEFINGSKGIINSSIHYPLYSYIMSIEAVFEEGIVNFSGMNMFNIKGKLSWFSNRPIKAVNMNYHKDMYAKGYELSFYDSVESFIKNYLVGKNPETDGFQGLFNMRLEKLIFESSINQSKVKL